jgi:hypothetical protein
MSVMQTVVCNVLCVVCTVQSVVQQSIANKNVTDIDALKTAVCEVMIDVYNLFVPKFKMSICVVVL